MTGLYGYMGIKPTAMVLLVQYSNPELISVLRAFTIFSLTITAEQWKKKKKKVSWNF